MNTTYIKCIAQSLLYFIILNLAVPFGYASSKWVKVDDFEDSNLKHWGKADTRNDTTPKLESPQVTEIRKDASGNNYLLKKPAPDGIVGNRKALTYKALPQPVNVGHTVTFFTRVNVEYFPNNHVFGISDMGPEGIKTHDYNAFEPSLRITDKRESNGLKNDGTLMVKTPNGYSKIYNEKEKRPAMPLEPGTWYDIWYVVNNRTKADGGQVYDVYIRGGKEFPEQTQVYKNASFRMARERPLITFLANCNTGPVDKPYGNGGIGYDDIYMSEGLNLGLPF